MLQDNKAKFKVSFYRFFSKVQILLGVLLILLIGYTIISGIATDNLLEQTDILITLIIFLILSSIPFILGIRNSILVKQFKIYLPRLLHDKTRSIDQLASNLSLSEEVVKQQLKTMIKKGYFTNAYIDSNTNCVIFAGKDTPTQEILKTYTNNYGNSDDLLSTRNSGEEVVQGTYKTKNCSNCGTSNKIRVGAANACDYCGSVIK